MTKRRVLVSLLILIALAAFAVWLEPTRIVWGWLRGEALYQGRPTSWWRRELPQWQFYPRGNAFVRLDDNIFVRIGWQKKHARLTPVAPIDPNDGGSAVLLELLQDPSQTVRYWAEKCLTHQAGDPQ